MAELSSYLRHLPPVLWEAPGPEYGPTDTTRFGLGTFLLAFEKILTGLDDDVVVRHVSGAREHTHDSIAAAIGRIPELFDPWHAPPEFLPWLASWVALEFPTLQDKPLWDEYQRRRATSQIARIHRLRGLKPGLNQALDLFSLIRIRPRVAIDDGNKLLTTRPMPDQLAPVTALVSQGPTLSPPPITSASNVIVNGLVRPRCIATGSAGSLFVGDFGAAKTVSKLSSRLWRVNAAGMPDTAGIPPLPRPLVAGTELTNVVAVAVSPPQGGRPETLYFLDGNKKLLSLATPYTADTATLEKTLPTVKPVAMAVDNNGDILVLDRGNIAEEPAHPKIVVVRPGQAAVQSHDLPMVVEPLSLFVRHDGSLIIGDGENQQERQAGNLVKIDRTNADWPAARMLPQAQIEPGDVPADNPLVSPSAVAPAEDGALFVLDAGLRPFASGDLALTIARPAAVFRVDTQADPVLVTRVTENGNLVFPTAMVSHEGRLVICDPGQLESRQQAPVLSRLAPFRFCVVVHFESANLPDDEGERTRVLGRVSASIRGVVDELRPAHTLFTLIIAG